MIVIKNHEQHIRDIENSLTREKNRLDYLKRCEIGEQKWAAKKADLVREIGIQLGKITAYEDALDMAKAYQTHDESAKPVTPNLRRYNAKDLVAGDHVFIDATELTVSKAYPHHRYPETFVVEFQAEEKGDQPLLLGVMLRPFDLVDVIEPLELQQEKVTF